MRVLDKIQSAEKAPRHDDDADDETNASHLVVLYRLFVCDDLQNTGPEQGKCLSERAAREQF